jgi:hypothetical protein
VVEKITPFLSSPVTPDSAEKIAPNNVASYTPFVSPCPVSGDKVFYPP